jgi:DNA-binding response OmpR family regulator
MLEENATMHGTVLLVEDDVALVHLMNEALARAGHQVHAVGRVAEAINTLERLRRHLDVIVLDYRLADNETAEPIVRSVLELRLDVAIVFMTGLDPASMRPVAAGLRADLMLAKPFGMDTLVASVQEGLRCVRRRRGHLAGVPEEWLERGMYFSRRANAVAKLADADSRDRDLLRLRFEGRPWHEITRQMAMSRSTAQRREREFMAKLGLSDLFGDVDRLLTEACARGDLRERDFLDASVGDGRSFGYTP